MTQATTNRGATNYNTTRRTGTSIAIAATPVFAPTSINIPSPRAVVRKLSKAAWTNVRDRWNTMRDTMEPASLCYSRPTLKWHTDPKSPEMVEKIAEWNAYGDEVLNSLILTSGETNIVEAVAPRAPMTTAARRSTPAHKCTEKRMAA